MMHHKFLCVLVLAVACGKLGVADAAYVIKLKNGNEFLTSRYWQEGTQVLFETYNGIFGIDKAFVSKVEKTDKPIRLIQTPPAAPDPKPADSENKQASETKKAPSESPEKDSVKRSEDDPIFRHFQGIKERAKSLDGMLTSELTQFAKDLADLKRAMQLGGKTNEFLAEFGEIHDIADRVEQALKNRR
jgi:hypothetical protein